MSYKFTVQGQFWVLIWVVIVIDLFLGQAINFLYFFDVKMALMDKDSIKIKGKL